MTKSTCKMIIGTRFEIGDEVYFMHENEPRASRIQGVEIYINANEKALISYQIENFGRLFKEEELAETRDELQEKVFG